MRPSTGRLRAGAPFALGSTALLVSGVALACHHPTSPGLALTGFALWCLAAWRWQSVWLFVLPACLPAADFAPWTGWIAFDEFDLIVVGALSAGYARSMRRCLGVGADSSPPVGSISRQVAGVAVVCAAVALVAIVRAVLAADSPAFGWYDGELDPGNALRVGKSELYALLLLPLLHRECMRSRADVVRRFAAGMLVGLTTVCAAVLWERAIQPGLFDLSQPYRTVAFFWEMHVGGAAIDAYLVMAVPFAARAVVQSRTPLAFAASALLAALAEYACLTTFSRGLYAALAGGLVVFAAMAARGGFGRSTPPWRRPANLALLLILTGQLIAVLGSDSFMRHRIERGNADLKSRLAHWSRGIGLMHGSADWWLGKGMGRLPAALAWSAEPSVEISGRARVLPDGGQTRLEVRGPPSKDALAGLFTLSQRIPAGSMPYRLELDVRAAGATALGVAVCEVHLLYEGECRRAVAPIPASGPEWQHLKLSIDGSRQPSPRLLPRSTVFSLAVIRAGGVVELDHLVLAGEGRGNMLQNADFSHGLAHWYPIAKDYFVPWHIDSLALELLIEQGIAGLVAFGWVMTCAFLAVLSAHRTTRPTDRIEPALAAALAAALLVGLVSSVIDMPRAAFLLFFLALLSVQLAEAPASIGAQRLAAGRRVVGGVK